MKMAYLKNSKGMMLLLVLSVVAVLAVATASIIMVSNSDLTMQSRQDESTKAFYVAEAGVAKARTQLNTDWTDLSTISSSVGGGTCQVVISSSDAGGGPLPAGQLRMRSRGAVAGIERTVDVVAEGIEPADPSGIDDAVETNGALTIQGNAAITGGVEEFAGLNFAVTFGITKAQMEAVARAGWGIAYDEVFLNDETDIVTWIESPAKESQVTDNGWVGGGIFVVQGDFKITGGVFNGVLWVEGALIISGNPEINGAVFVEGGATVDTTVTGTADITFDADVVADAFEELGNIPPFIISWQEV